VPWSQGLSGLGIQIGASAKEPLGGGFPGPLKPVDCLGLWTVLSGAQAGHALLRA